MSLPSPLIPTVSAMSARIIPLAVALGFGCVTLAWITPVSAQVQSAEALDYQIRKRAFEGIPLKTRVMLQVLLIATGDLNAVPTEGYTVRLNQAVQKSRLRYGTLLDGETERWIERMASDAKSNFSLWDFRTAIHPDAKLAIWMPHGMGLRYNRDALGTIAESDRYNVSVRYSFHPDTAIDVRYAAQVRGSQETGATIHYAVRKNDWYVISKTSAAGVDSYERYHAYAGGSFGFRIAWNDQKGDLHGERIAILMSASLGSVLNGRPFIAPPGEKTAEPPVQEARTQTPMPTLAAAPPVPPVAAAPRPSAVKGHGTGFFVSGTGSIVTNHHVVEGCTALTVRPAQSGRPLAARLIASDNRNDLALLSVDAPPDQSFARLRISARLGEGVSIFGYPLSDYVSSSGNFTQGIISALAGMGDDTSQYQTTAPVQPGNSGGPMLDGNGNVIGVVVAQLNALKVASATGGIPQNINFAIKSATLSGFLESHKISVEPAAYDASKRLDGADLADRARAISVHIECRG